jgi:hypothetical protein
MPDRRAGNQGLPLKLGREYRGFVDYLFMKQDIADMPLSEANAFTGLRLICALVLKFPSVRRGYRDYRWLEQVICEHAERGEQVVVSDSGSTFTVKVR